jgi:hypoxanthine phosphoribosyltransferase
MSDLRPLIDARAIAERVTALGRKISDDHRGHELVVVPVLKGSFVFAADLVRALDVPCRVYFLGVRSYGAGTESTGVVELTHDLGRPIEGCHVLLVEDIVDTGLTIAYLLDVLRTRRPASLKVAAFLQKPARTEVDVPIDYLGFTIEDVFVVGYGLDHDERHRELPYVAALSGVP